MMPDLHNVEDHLADQAARVLLELNEFLGDDLAEYLPTPVVDALDGLRSALDWYHDLVSVR